MSEPLYRIVFMGTPDFAVPSLKALAEAGMKPVLCVSQPDKPQGRKRKILPTPVKSEAMALGIPVLQAKKVRNKAFLEAIREAEPDFIVTAAYGRILTDEVLACPKIAPVNVHASLLPKYRGAAPVQAALINQDKVTGVSIPRMVSEMDAGPVYRRAEYVIPDGMRADRLMHELSLLGASVLPQTLIDIAENNLLPVPQNEAEASHVPLLDKHSGTLDFAASAFAAEGLIRGCYPWPSAVCELEGKRFKFLAGKAFAEDAPELPGDLERDLPPGSVASTSGRRIWLVFGEGFLRLDELQPAGSRAMKSEDCAHNYRIGMRFDSAALPES